jgi:hypothetical protein
MTSPLGPELLQRLRDRARDPGRRSDEAALAAGSTPPGDALRVQREQVASLPEDVQHGVGEYLSGMNTPLAGMIANSVTGDGTQARGLLGALESLMGGRQMFAMSGDLGLVSMGGLADPTPAPPAATEQEVAAAEQALGFALPPALRQLYLDVADGGVGPGDGLFSLSELVAKHREMTSEAVGPQGQDWPAGLLPISGQDWDLVSLDRSTGQLVYWDLEELDDDDELPPDQPTWAASFVREATSLEAWLTSWASA